MRVAIAALVIAACKSAPAPVLPPAGDDRDEGAGELARASVQLELGTDGSAGLPEVEPPARSEDDGSAAPFSDWQPPSVTAVEHAVPYNVVDSGLEGSIEGVVTWSGAAPHLPCGAGLRVGADHSIEGAIIYIAKVRAGRAFATHASGIAIPSPVQVGGTLVKRGCALAPAVQVMAPVPATLAVRGDAGAAELRVTGPSGAPATFALDAGGAVPLQIATGVTRLDAADGSLGPAWVIGVETPYVSVTDDTGRFRIDSLVPDTYDVTIFAAPSTPGGAPIVVHRSVRVGAGVAQLPVRL